MPIKKLPDGRYHVRVQATDQRDGRPINRKGTATTKAEALSLERQFRAEAAAGVRPRRRQLVTYVRSWARDRADTLKPSVRQKYGTSLDHHILPALGELYLDAIVPGDVQRYVTDRLTAGAAGNTVLNELRLIRTIAADSVADGSAPRNWAARVKAPPVSSYTEERPNMLTAPQLAQVLTTIPRRWRGLVLLMATTGLRWGEASAIQWGDIERWRDPSPGNPLPWDAVGQIRIQRGNWKGQAISSPKTAASLRRVPLLREVADQLGPPIGLWVFGTADGELHRGTPLRAVLDRVAVKLGWARWVGVRGNQKAEGFRITPHGLRRTWNDLARQRGDRLVVQAITGHATDVMTERYSLVRADEKARLASSVRESLEATSATPSDSPESSPDRRASRGK